MYKKYLISIALLLVVIGLAIAIIMPSGEVCSGVLEKNSSCYYLVNRYDTIPNGNSQYRTDNAYPDNVMLDKFSVYVENSASIDAYVCSMSETDKKGNKKNNFTMLKNVVDHLLANASGISRENKCFYVNDTIVEYTGTDFARDGLTIEKMNPKSAKNAVMGNRGNTELWHVVDTVIKRNGANEVSVLISDFVPSPKGSSDDDIKNHISSYVNHVKGSLKAKLTSSPRLCIMLYRYNSEFDGIYYDTNDAHWPYKGSRPFYALFVGDYGLLSKLKSKTTIMNGKEPFCVYFASQMDVPYGAYSGQLKPHDFASHKGVRKHLQLSDELKQKAEKSAGVLFVKLKMDLSCLPCTKDYLLDKNNYKVESECFYIDKVEEAKGEDVNKWTHIVTLKNNKAIFPNNNKVRVLLQGEKFNWEEFSTMKNQDMKGKDTFQTLGIEPLRQGIEDAFKEMSKNPSSYSVFEFLIN